MNSTNKFVTALLQGDEIVIAKIYKQFFPKVLKFILQNKGTHDHAKDIFQDALIYLIVKIKEQNLKIDSFEAYLFTICKNIWRRELEKQKKWVMNDHVTKLIDKDTDFALFMLEQGRLELYQEKFSLLSDNCKRILSLFFNNTSYENIIKELSYTTVNTARQRIFKCKSKLIKLIKKDVRFIVYK